MILICEDSDKIQKSHRFRKAGGKVFWKGQESSESADSPSLWCTRLVEVGSLQLYLNQGHKPSSHHGILAYGKLFGSWTPKPIHPLQSWLLNLPIREPALKTPPS